MKENMTQRISITIKEADNSLMASFLNPTLVKSRAYKIDTPNIEHKLDQNECPFDWPEDIKQKVLERLQREPWQLYPAAFTEEVTEAIACEIGVCAENILTANGSNVLLSMLIQTLGRTLKGQIVVARPSFAHYESTCMYEGLSYEPWELDENLQYDITKLQNMPANSVVFFASPNNPVGNALEYEDLKKLLKAHPTTLFVADEAYFEFEDKDYLSLLSEYNNLILVRTFSKTMGAAGARIGYIVAAKEWINHFIKNRPPYLINLFGEHAALEAILNPRLQQFRLNLIDFIKQERAHMFKELSELSSKFSVVPPRANFLLIRFDDQKDLDKVYQGLIEHGILVRNVSRGPNLQGCFRVTIGQKHQNQLFLKAFKSLISS
jgi:histidinol-phosphate aminotransferase